ncbi:MAG: cytidylate kinase-like family protein [Verrucomicrobia bacterium]|nr:cytidylate kinase-like family protein [Verrucomicrobiota bacterium]
MNIGTHVDKCLSFIQCDLSAHGSHWLPDPNVQPAISLSRQTGCGVKEVAETLVRILPERAPKDRAPWTVFDRNLVARVIEDHRLPPEVAKFMPEDRVSAVQDAIEEILGLHPSSRTLLQKTSETIRHLAELGHVILIGRGANIITRDLANTFHVRLIAPIDVRVGKIMERNGIDAKAARDVVHKGDLARNRYIKDHFHADIDDPLLYDLVINTARLSAAAVARVIAEAVGRQPREG